MRTFPRSTNWRGLATGIIAAILVIALSACGDTDDAEGTQGTEGSSTTDAPTNDGSEVELPGDFPDEVPLPQDATLTSVTPIGDHGWRLMFSVDPEQEGHVEAYATRLTDAVFDVEAGTPAPENVGASNSEWRVDAVVRPPLITVQVLED